MDVALAFAWDSPPLSIIAAAKIAGVSLTIDRSLASGSAPTLYLGSV
jgi:glutamyl-tRNA synthetase